MPPEVVSLIYMSPVQVSKSQFLPLECELSDLVLGTALYTHEPPETSPELLDAWFALGGNALDTARHYGNSENVVGRWLRSRDCRDRVIIITKGAHYKRVDCSRVNPKQIVSDLNESLSALSIEYADVYLLHRDNPQAPVGPIIEVLNEQCALGRIRVFGASNWSPARLDEAQEYADSHGLMGFACSSPEFSLAVPVIEPWPGCRTIHNPEALAWYAHTHLPVFAWSSLSSGFFAGNRDHHVRDVYVDAQNELRLCHAKQLASKKGCTAIQIALAWVLHQSFDVRPIIGPQNAEELTECIKALAVELSPMECRFLDLQE